MTKPLTLLVPCYACRPAYQPRDEVLSWFYVTFSGSKDISGGLVSVRSRRWTPAAFTGPWIHAERSPEHDHNETQHITSVNGTLVSIRAILLSKARSFCWPEHATERTSRKSSVPAGRTLGDSKDWQRGSLTRAIHYVPSRHFYRKLVFTMYGVNEFGTTDRTFPGACGPQKASFSCNLTLDSRAPRAVSTYRCLHHHSSPEDRSYRKTMDTSLSPTVGE